MTPRSSLVLIFLVATCICSCKKNKNISSPPTPTAEVKCDILASRIDSHYVDGLPSRQDKRYEYDDKDRMVKVVENNGDLIMEYSEDGTIVKEVYSTGSSNVFQLNGNGRVVKKTQFDALGTKTQEYEFTITDNYVTKAKLKVYENGDSTTYVASFVNTIVDGDLVKVVETWDNSPSVITLEMTYDLDHRYSPSVEDAPYALYSNCWYYPITGPSKNVCTTVRSNNVLDHTYQYEFDAKGRVIKLTDEAPFANNTRTHIIISYPTYRCD